MSNQNQHINLPLERLFARLEAAGFAMDTARKLRLLRALDREGPRYIGRWDELKYLLAPFIARTAEEQSRFYEIYAEFQAECKAELSNLSNIQTRAAHQTLPQTLPQTLKRFWPLLVLLLALLVYGIIEIATPPKPKTLSLNIYQDVVLREGRETLIINRTATRDTSGFRWEVRDATTGDLEYAAASFHLRWKAIGAGREKHIILRAPEGRQKEIFEPLADALRLMVHCRDSLSASLPNIPASPLIKGQNYTFSVDTSQEVAALWIFSNGDSLRGGQIPKKFEEEGQFLLRLRRYRPGQEDYCYTEQEIPITVGADKPFLRTADLKRDHPRFQLGLKSWFWLLFLLPLLPALWLLQRWYQKRRERSPRRGLAEIEADYPIHDSGPYFIPYLPQEEKISVPPAFFRIADVLRRREAGIRREFDASASIRATARAGGFPSWRDQPLTRPAEYLLLIRRTDERHQQDRLFQRLAHFLEKRDAPVTAFYHDGRFERFQNQRHPEGLSLSQLYRRYADYRLIILGDAHGLVNPYATAAPTLLSAPLTELSRWPRRLLLTPEEVRFWSFQEALLHQHFRLFPATTEGILKGVEALDLDEEYVPEGGAALRAFGGLRPFEEFDAPAARLRGLRPFEEFDAPLARLSGLRPFESSEQLERAEGASNARSASNIQPSNIQTPNIQTPKPSNNPPPSNNPRFNPWESPRDHQIYLQSNELFRWLCALAVAEQPDWALTIAIGRALGIEVTHDRLLRLSRIPWLADNESHTGLRLALLRELDPADERLAREAVAEELAEARKHTDLTGSFAENEWVANMAVQRFALDPRDDEHKKSIRELQEIGLLSEGQLTELDFIVRERADKKGLPGGAADSLDDWLDTPEPKPVFTRELGLAVGLIVFSLVLYLLGWSYHSRNLEAEPGYQAAFWQSARPLDDRALQLNNLAVGIGDRSDSLRSWQSWQARGDSLSLADSLLGLAVRLRSPDAYLLADSNQISLRFNIAARRLNFFLTDSADAGGLQRNADEFMLALPPTYPGDPRRLAALHGHGLCLYYLGEYLSAAGDAILLDSARRVRDRLLTDSGGAFFDSIRAETPVNLATLLAALSDPAEQTGSSDTAPDQVVDKRSDYATIRLGDKIWLAENLSLYVPGARCYDAAAVDCEQYGLLYTWPQALSACQALGAGWRLPSEAEWREMVLSFGGYYDWYTKEATGSATEAYRKLMVGGESGFNALLGGLKISEGGSYDIDINGDYWTSTDSTAAQAWNYNFNNETGGTVTRVVNPKSWAFSCRCVQDVEPPAQTQDTPVAPPLNALRGRVLDAATREPLANVQIVINGQTFVSQSGTGAYVLNDSVDQTPPLRLRFSLAGYQTQDATLSPNRGNALPDVLLEKTGGDIPRPGMIRVAGGTFEMGDVMDDKEYDDETVHTATVNDFFIGQYEVTQTEWLALMSDVNPENTPGFEGCANCPIERVSWYDAAVYCNRLSEQHGYAPVYYADPNFTQVFGKDGAAWRLPNEGNVYWNPAAKGYRLPTEAEWEYAAREGGRKVRFGNGKDLADPAEINFNASADYKKDYSIVGQYRQKTTPAGSLKSPNNLGLHDMSGNVYEWCWDWYADYPKDPQTNPVGPLTGALRVIRGGSWVNDPRDVRAAVRNDSDPNVRNDGIGFRLARTP